MCQETRNFLCAFCPFDDKCEEERIIYLHAFRYWNFDIMPPNEYKEKVSNFISAHPSVFKGAGPQ